MKTKHKNTTNDSKLAARWGCDERTIRRWRKVGAPFDDAARMRRWLSTRREVPEGTVAILRKLRTRQPSTPLPQEPAAAGAAQALNRLERKEEEAYLAYEAARVGGDEVEIAAKLKIWLALLESLRRFDAQIAEERRVAHEMVSRAQVGKDLALLLHWWRVFVRQQVLDAASLSGAPAALINRLDVAADDALLRAIGTAKFCHQLSDPPAEYLTEAAIEVVKNGFAVIDDARIQGVCWIQKLILGLQDWAGKDPKRGESITTAFRALYKQAGLPFPESADL